MKKFAKREKDFGKKTAPKSFEDAVCLAHKEKHPTQDSTRGRDDRRGRGRYFRGRGGQTFSRRKGIFALHSLQKKWIT